MAVSQISLKRAISAAKAILFGQKVCEQRLETRLRVCGQCPYSKERTDTHMVCDICGCGLPKQAKLLNLALYEETDDYGCKHPEGSRWKAAGV